MKLLAAPIALLLGSSAIRASETIAYSYDAQGRLVSVTHSGSVNNGLAASYTHDNADNRVNVTTPVPCARFVDSIIGKVTLWRGDEPLIGKVRR